MPMRYNPWPYQKIAEEYILSHPQAGLFLEMGLGKTVVTLSAIKRLIQSGTVRKVLVIAPLRVAATVWAQEAEKWEHLQDLRCSHVLGQKIERIAGLEAEADIYIMNRENVEWLVKYFVEKGEIWPFDMVVIDELSSFKSCTSHRFRYLRKVMPHVKRVVGLTGTPAPNGLLDLWAQIYLLDGGKRFGRTMTAFRQRYFLPGRRGAYVVWEWVPKPGAAEAILRDISDLCMSMKAEDYLQLPDRVDVIHRVDLSKGHMREYCKLRDEMCLKAANRVEITATSAAVCANKLLQYTGGCVYGDDRYAVYHAHDAKLNALEDIIEAANGHPVLVYYGYKHELKRILERFPEARELQDASDVKLWNEGKIPILVAHPDSAGHGLNLQQGGHIMVWFTLTWSLEKYQQANARLHRQGQKEPVKIYHIIATGTIDERVLKVLDRKEGTQDSIIEAVRAECIELAERKNTDFRFQKEERRTAYLEQCKGRGRPTTS